MSKDISIIVPIYNEEESLPHLLKRVSEAMRATDFKWEIICVDDGSSDRSAEMLEELKEELRKNQGILKGRKKDYLKKT